MYGVLEGKSVTRLLGDKAYAPDFWAGVREKDCYKKFREELHTMWSRHCEGIAIEVIPYAVFKLFWKTGDRKAFEDMYFRRRKAMDCSALLALVYPEEQKYLARLMDEIHAICDEYCWSLPAHQGPIEVNNNAVIDLFAAETGFTLAEIYHLLENRLEPLIKSRIKAEIDRRIVTPYLATDSYGHWESADNNWAAVCTGSVACTLMLMRPELAEALIPRFKKSIDGYLDGFRDDGICFEGHGYWHYGFGYFTAFADMLRRFTNGKEDYFKRERVKSIATFIQKIFLSRDAAVCFSDTAGGAARYHLGLVHYLKNEYPDEVLVYSPEYSYNYDLCGRFCLQLRSAIWLDEEIYNSPTPEDAEAEYFAEKSQWFIKRTAAYGFAAKAGHNDEFQHNHNDVGSFIFAKNGKYVVAELGSGTYTKQYFDKRTRYKHLVCSARGHSVPIVNGELQSQGKRFKASKMEYKGGALEIEFAEAYNLRELKQLTRSFKFEENGVTMTDRFYCNDFTKIVERIIATEKPDISETGVIKIADGEIIYNPSICSVTVTSEIYKGKLLDYAVNAPKDDYDATCYMIDFLLSDGEKTFTCTIK